MTPSRSYNRSIRLLLGLLVLALLPALNAWADVRDQAGLFSQQAVQQANSTIEKIRQQTGKDVVVEAFPEIPSDLRSNYDPAQKAVFFNNWMRNRARQLGVNGIYILINRNPSYLDVGVGTETAKRAFTMSDRNQLASTMLGYFRNKQYDQGLLAGVNFIQQRMQANLGQGGSKPQYMYQSPNAPQSRGGGLGWGWWVLIILGILVLFSWLRRLGRSQSYAYGGPGGPPYRAGPGMGGGYPPGGAYPPGGGYPPGAGGGFGRGILGGLLGGAAGGWLYDRMFGGGHGSQAYGAPPPTGGQAGEQPLPPDQGQGFEGTGGSFDQPQGGPDYGGGGGGGDWGGGGDLGGGGDAGGGGGDQSGGTF